MLTNKKAKDAEMAKRLAKTHPSPKSHRPYKPESWPYHNNLGTRHSRPKNEVKERTI